MGFFDFLRSKWSRKLSALATLLKAYRTFEHGNKRLALALVGAAAVAYRYSGLGFLVQLAVRFWTRRNCGDHLRSA